MNKVADIMPTYKYELFIIFLDSQLLKVGKSIILNITENKHFYMQLLYRYIIYAKYIGAGR